MKTLKLLRYALLLVAAFAYLNGPSRLDASRATTRGGDVTAFVYSNGSSQLSAAPSGLMSCSECTSETPCDTECQGVYAEELWETTCGAHRNWGGECAGECGDNFCDPLEYPGNCCIDCDPYNCNPQCEPQWTAWTYHETLARGPVVRFIGAGEWGCYYVATRHKSREALNECAEDEDGCIWQYYDIFEYVWSPAGDPWVECINHYEWLYGSPFGNVYSCPY